MPKERPREPFKLPNSEAGRETQASKAYHAVRAMILRCELPPGSLINDRELTRQVGIGRTPIREALLRLASERLVVFQGNQSIQVAPVGFAEINDIYTVRLHLERLAWRLWVERASDEQVARLVHRFDRVPALVRAGDIEELINLDFIFHSQVYQECGNPILSQNLHSLSGVTYRLWFITNQKDIRAQANTARSHAPIIEAVRRRDVKALDTEISRHIAGAYEKIVDLFKTKIISRIGDMQIQLFTEEERHEKRNR
jgi:DNA-binding GntR family transcriptional regulator